MAVEAASQAESQDQGRPVTHAMGGQPWTARREDGLLIWASTEHENLYCWKACGDDPDRWPVVVQSFDGEVVAFDCRAAEFICRVLIDQHHPFTMARYFDTHWFMSYRASD